jgi:DNA-binding LytR/AlgR family response regulator
MYYEVFQRKVVIYLKNGAEIVTRKTIKEMQESIPEKHFIAIYRDCVVNANYIKSVGDNMIILDDEQKLVVSRLRMKAVKEAIMEFWGNLM